MKFYSNAGQDLQMTNERCRFVIYFMNMGNWITMTTVTPRFMTQKSSETLGKIPKNAKCKVKSRQIRHRNATGHTITIIKIKGLPNSPSVCCDT